MNTQIHIISHKLLFLTIETLNLQQVDAEEFYTNEEIRLTALVEEEKNVALSKPLGVAFVTLGISLLYIYIYFYIYIYTYIYICVFILQLE